VQSLFPRRPLGIGSGQALPPLPLIIIERTCKLPSIVEAEYYARIYADMTLF